MNTAQAPEKRRRVAIFRPVFYLPAGFLLVLVAGFTIAELTAWRFLAAPIERFASRALERKLSFGDAKDQERFRLHLLGGIRLQLEALTIADRGDPRTPMILARDVSAQLRYRDLLAFRPGEALSIHSLAAVSLDLKLTRAANGSANWLFGSPRTDGSRPVINGLRFGGVKVAKGRLDYHDAALVLDLNGHFSFDDSSDELAGSARPPPVSGLQGEAAGHYQGQPLRARIRTGPLLAAFAGDASDANVALQIGASTGKSALALDGNVNDIFGARRFDTAFTLKGPSLAAVGKPLGVTLPVTAPFSMRGRLAYDNQVWNAGIAYARIGRSELGGEFAFRQAGEAQRPRLDGRLTAKALWLEDLGPSIGAAGAGAETRPQLSSRRGRVLPDREFDLPALRAMDADIHIALDRLELGTPALEDIHPLRARLLLRDGLLALEDLDATLARGHVRGRIALDGRSEPARWQTKLELSGIALETWIRQGTGDARAPYVSGRLAGQVELGGAGRSTAAILGSAHGTVRLMMIRGGLSHLALEVAGLDVAQALGVLISGDERLPVSCGIVALSVDRGMVRPELFVLDTRDSLVRVGGGASLATERLDLLAQVSPKDFSPLALRTPVRVRGSFANPSVRVEPGPLILRLGAAAALATLNPFAALLPLMDPGVADGQADAAVCELLAPGQTAAQARVGHG